MARPANELTASFSFGSRRVPGDRPPLPERWRVIRMLGSGGQGDVWLAEDLELQQRVALKVIFTGGAAGATAVRRARQEARLGRDLEHPALVRVFDLVATEQHLVVVMEWLDGGSLREALAAGPLPAGEVISVADRLLSALAYLHGRGIVHRDVKTANVIAASSGRLKLGDLGLLAGAGGDDDEGRVPGTAAYMSPEQRRGGEATPASDLYAVGVTLFELLTGTLPRRPGTVSALPAANELRRVRRDCPGWLAAFVRRLLAPEPAGRWPDAGAAQAWFRRRRRLASPRTRRLIFGGAAAVIAVVAGLMAMAGNRSPAVQVVSDSHGVTGIGPRGEPVWTYAAEGVVKDISRVDLVGDDVPEVVAVVGDTHHGFQRRPASIVVLDAWGRRLGVMEPARLGSSAGEPIATEPSIAAVGHADFDGDGREDLFWLSRVTDWYESAAEVWFSGSGEQSILLRNSGHIHDAMAADVDGDGRKEIVACGINNALGFQQFVAVTEVVRGSQGAHSPDQALVGTKVFNTAMLPTYALLGPADGPCRLEEASVHGIVATTATHTVRLSPRTDAPGAFSMAASDVALPEDWAELVRLCRLGEAGVPEALQAWRRRLADKEATASSSTFETAAALLFSRSLATAGDRAEAVDVLQDAVSRFPDVRDLWLRLGEQLLLDGRSEAGRKAVLESMKSDGKGRNLNDAVMILGLESILGGRWSAAGSVLQRLHPTDAWRWFGPAFERAHAFTQGQWSDPVFSGDRAADYLLAWIPVVDLWAELERGASPEQILDRAGGLAEAPELELQARLLMARARLLQGDPAAARGLARPALLRLDRLGRTRYEWFFWVPLAESIYGEALLETGGGDALRHLRRAARLAPATWYGRRAAALAGSAATVAGSGPIH